MGNGNFKPTAPPPSVGGDTTTPNVPGNFIQGHYKPPQRPNDGAGYYDPDGTWHPFTALNTLGRGMEHGKNQYGTLYTDEDAWTPGNNADTTIQTQKLMVEAGLIDPRSIRLGVWDVKSANAYKTVLAFANAYGSDAKGALRILAQNPTLGQQAGKRVAPQMIDSPVSSYNTYQQTAEQLTGKDAPVGSAMRFAADYEQKQKDLVAKAQAQNGGTIEQLPSQSDLAQQQLQNSVDAQAYGAAARQIAFYDMLKSPT